MSGISKFKRIYSEGVAKDHSDLKGQPEFANKADEILARRKKDRAQSGKNAKLDAIGRKLYNMNKIGEETELDEKIDVGADAGATISDFVHSKSKTFKGDSKKQRIKRALGAYYGAQKEETEMKDIEEKFIPLNKSRSERSERRVTDLNSRSLQAYRSGQPEPGEHYAKRADKIADTTLELLGGPRRTSGSKRFARKEREGKAWANKTKGENKRSLERAFKGPSATKEELDYSDAYNYVIEALVDADFAQDYETAENMFECMSDEFVAVILEDYIEEKARGTRPKKTIHAYDVDETLFGHGKKGKPNVQVHVKDASGKRVQSLSNQEFNTHKLDKDKGHSYDFSEFQSAKTFSKTSTPNKKTIKDVKRKQARGQNVHIITARSKFDKPSEFQGHLKKHGVDVPMNKIHYTGGMKGGDIGKKKVDTAKGIAKQSGAKTTHMYDDAAKVNNAFEKEKQNNPTSTKIKTHLAKPNASGETTLRSYQATKGGRTSDNPSSTTKQTQRRRKKARKNMGEEMTPYEYWKQFINEDSELISELSVTAQRELDALKRIPSNLARNAASKLKPNMLMRREIGNLARIPFTAPPRLARAGLGRAALGVDTVLNTRAQEQGAEDFLRRSGGVRQGELYKASDVDSKGAPKAGANPQLASIEAAVRGKQATKDSKSTITKPTDNISRKVIDAKNIAGNQQKVTTNKAYDAKLGGVKASATYGDAGQRMIRANIGNAGVNQVKAGKAKVGQSYASQLGGLKGTVKYDAQGNRSFQALQQKATPLKPVK